MNPIKTREDRFAEYISQGLRPTEAALAMNLTKGQAARTWANIKRRMGAQAA